METQLSCLRDLSGSRRVITPGTGAFSSLSFHSLVLCDFNSVTPPLPGNPRGWVSFLLLRSSHSRLPRLGISNRILCVVKLSLS